MAEVFHFKTHKSQPKACDLKTLLEESARIHRDRPFLIESGRVISYREVNALVNCIANQLLALGLGAGARVGILSRTRADFVLCWFGAAKAGSVIVPLHPQSRQNEIARIINRYRIKLIFVEEDLLEIAQSAASAQAQFVLLGWEGRCGRGVPDLQLFCLHGDCDPSTLITGSAPASILFTSGTSGEPKGVLLPHYAYINSVRSHIEIMKPTSEDRFFTALPLCHIGAQSVIVILAISVGASCVLFPSFHAHTFWEEIRQTQSTVFQYVGAMLSMLDQQPPSPTDTNHGAKFGVGAGASPRLYEKFEERFGVKLIEGYGMTESALLGTIYPPEKHKAGSIGIPKLGTEIEILDSSGQPLPAGVVGEICIRPQIPFTMMLGYADDPEATTAAWRNQWFHTGDFGYKDEEGFFYFVDRADGRIRRRGENISAAEIEAAVTEHPAVKECAAVGIPSELGDEEILLVVVPVDGYTLDPVEISAWCHERLADFKVPRFIRFKDPLEKSLSGKILRKRLREERVASAWDRLSRNTESRRESGGENNRH